MSGYVSNLPDIESLDESFPVVRSNCLSDSGIVRLPIKADYDKSGCLIGSIDTSEMSTAEYALLKNQYDPMRFRLS